MCSFLCFYLWCVLTSTRRYHTEGYQGPKWQAMTEEISGLVEVYFETERICSLIDRISLSIVSSTFNLSKIFIFGRRFTIRGEKGVTCQQRRVTGKF